MIIVDKALEKRQSENNPVRVALIGSGYMGRGIAIEILTSIVGMRLVAVCNRTISGAAEAYRQGGVDSVKVVNSVNDLESAIDANQYAITDDPSLICQAGNIEAVIDATGETEFGAHIATAAIANGKHIILMNAELDSTVGPILKADADKAGVVYTYTDGDEPGVAMNLYRFVKTIGYQPVLMGQIKGFLDRYRNPETQQGFAAKYSQK